MTIRGRFGDTSGSPYVEALLVIPRFGILGRLSFLVDTGASRTFLAPTDGRLLNIPYESGAFKGLESKSARGIGRGGAECRLVEAELYFAANEAVYGYQIVAYIPVPVPELAGIPSLLGRDIISQWAMKSDPVAGDLRFLPKKYDSRLDFRPRRSG